MSIPWILRSLSSIFETIVTSIVYGISTSIMQLPTNFSLLSRPTVFTGCDRITSDEWSNGQEMPPSFPIMVLSVIIYPLFFFFEKRVLIQHHTSGGYVTLLKEVIVCNGSSHYHRRSRRDPCRLTNLSNSGKQCWGEENRAEGKLNSHEFSRVVIRLNEEMSSFFLF